jgi:hypothetical protein
MVENYSSKLKQGNKKLILILDKNGIFEDLNRFSLS